MDENKFVCRAQKVYFPLWERIKIFFEGICAEVDVEVFINDEEEKSFSTHFRKTYLFAILYEYTEDFLPESIILWQNGKPLCTPNTIQLKKYNVFPQYNLTFFERLKILFKRDPLIKVCVCLGKNWEERINGYAKVPLSRIILKYNHEYLSKDDIFENKDYWTMRRRRRARESFLCYDSAENFAEKIKELKDCSPRIHIPNEFENKDEYLRHLVEEGLKERYKEITLQIRERAEYEMQIIFSKNFSGYYLFTLEFVTWAKSTWDNVNNKPKPYIAVGPGRGSDASSLVAYCIGITDVDPIKYGLLFEHFINLEHDWVPDFDIDVDYDYREEVIQHLRDLYGKNCVGRIVAGEKTISEHGIILHPCGVVVSKTALSNFVPVFVDENTGELVSQYSTDRLEQCGLVKHDILGHKTLSFISKMENEIRKKTGNSKFKISDIDENDKETFELFRRGDTKGVFQFESSKMQEYLKQLNSVCMEDLIALNSLYRPGAMDYIPEFIARKNNPDFVKYPFQCLEEILKETYGLIVYQEQFMLIVQKIAGCSLAKVDFFRNDLCKKNDGVVLIRKNEFEACAIKNGYSVEDANEIFDLLLKFSGYVFSKSHAAACSKLAYQTAWLKCHYPEEFSCLCSVIEEEV